jgi:CBS domain-containing protein
MQTIQEIVGNERSKLSVDSKLSVHDVLEYMREQNAGAVAVSDEGRFVGVFSTRDILRRVALEGFDLTTVAVGEVMSTPLYWISPDERYEVAKAIMVDKEVRRLAVLDGRRNFKGFVSSLELLQADLSNSRDLVSKLNDDYYEQRFEPQKRA